MLSENSLTKIIIKKKFTKICQFIDFTIFIKNHLFELNNNITTKKTILLSKWMVCIL
jgi:hypothetical protein